MYCNQFQVVIVCKPLVWQQTYLFHWQFILLFTSLQKHFDLLHSEKKLFVIEFNRDSVIVLYLAGKPQAVTITRYRDTGSVALRPKGEQKKR